MAMGTRSRGQAPSTNSPRLSVRSSYEDFKPLIESKEDSDAHSVRIHLPGFLKEQIRIVAESNRNMLRVRGERFVSGSTWNRFQEEIAVPENCDITETRSKFEGGVLRITMPKRITAVASESSSPSELSSDSEAERSADLPRRIGPRMFLDNHPIPSPAPSRPAPRPPLPHPDAARFTPSIYPKPRENERSRFESSQNPSLPLPPLGLLQALPQPEPAMKDPIASERWRNEPDQAPIRNPTGAERWRNESDPAQVRDLIGPERRRTESDQARMRDPIGPERRRTESDQAPMRDPIVPERRRTESDPAPVRDPIVPERRRIESDPEAMRDPIDLKRRRSDPAQVRDLIGPERRRTESDQARMRDPIGPERRRTESDQAPMRDPIVPERRRTESDPAPVRDPIVPERRRIESDPEAMRDPIDLKRRRIESETPLKKPVTSTIADLPGKAPMRYESLTEEEKRRFGMRGMRLRGLEEDRQLLVNMGVAVLVLVSFGAWISYSFGCSSSNQ